MAHNKKYCAPTSYQEFPRSHSGSHPQTTSGSRYPGWCFRSSGPQLSCCLCETCWWTRSLHTFWWSCLLHTRRCTGIHHFSPQVLHQNRDTRGSLLVSPCGFGKELKKFTLSEPHGKWTSHQYSFTLFKRTIKPIPVIHTVGQHRSGLCHDNNWHTCKCKIPS